MLGCSFSVAEPLNPDYPDYSTTSQHFWRTCLHEKSFISKKLTEEGGVSGWEKKTSKHLLSPLSSAAITTFSTPGILHSLCNQHNCTACNIPYSSFSPRNLHKFLPNPRSLTSPLPIHNGSHSFHYCYLILNLSVTAPRIRIRHALRDASHRPYTFTIIHSWYICNKIEIL